MLPEWVYKVCLVVQLVTIGIALFSIGVSVHTWWCYLR